MPPDHPRPPPRVPPATQSSSALQESIRPTLQPPSTPVLQPPATAAPATAAPATAAPATAAPAPQPPPVTPTVPQPPAPAPTPALIQPPAQPPVAAGSSAPLPTRPSTPTLVQPPPPSTPILAQPVQNALPAITPALSHPSAPAPTPALGLAPGAQAHLPAAAPAPAPAPVAGPAAPAADDTMSVRKSLLDDIVEHQAKRIRDLERRLDKKRAKIDLLSSAPVFHSFLPPHMTLMAQPIPPPPAVPAPGAAAGHSAVAAAAEAHVHQQAAVAAQQNPYFAAAAAADPQLRVAAAAAHAVATQTDADRKQSRYWTNDEHQRFLHAVKQCGPKNYVQIADVVATRNPKQVRTHAQKFQKKLERENAKRRPGGPLPLTPTAMAAAAAAASPASAAAAAAAVSFPHNALHAQMHGLDAAMPSSSESGKSASDTLEARPQRGSSEGTSSTNEFNPPEAAAPAVIFHAPRAGTPGSSAGAPVALQIPPQEPNAAAAAMAAIAAEAAALSGLSTMGHHPGRVPLANSLPGVTAKAPVLGMASEALEALAGGMPGESGGTADALLAADALIVKSSPGPEKEGVAKAEDVQVAPPVGAPLPVLPPVSASPGPAPVAPPPTLGKYVAGNVASKVAAGSAELGNGVAPVVPASAPSALPTSSRVANGGASAPAPSPPCETSGEAAAETEARNVKAVAGHASESVVLARN